MGSCFSEHIGSYLQRNKFNTVVNPFGQQYNPISIAKALRRLLANENYNEQELFYFNHLWNSFDHHSDFSAPDLAETLHRIHSQFLAASEALKQCDILFITPGTAHVFERKTDNVPVNNCHKLPSETFIKRLLSVDEIMFEFQTVFLELFRLRPGLQIVFTVSPVRYFAFGATENTLSKSILFVAIHRLKQQFSDVHYFPAYEIVMDELRDYRFFAEDMLHPNYQATAYVWNKLKDGFFDKKTLNYVEEITSILQAVNHQPRNAQTKQHHNFCEKTLERIQRLQSVLPILNFDKEKERLMHFLKS